MTAKKWAGIMSAVVVGVLVAAAIFWGVNTVSDAGAERDAATQEQAERDALEAVAESAVERRDVDEQECAEEAEAVEADTYDYDSTMIGTVYRAAAGDYDVAFSICMEDRGYSPPF